MSVDVEDRKEEVALFHEEAYQDGCRSGLRRVQWHPGQRFTGVAYAGLYNIGHEVLFSGAARSILSDIVAYYSHNLSYTTL